MKFTQQGSANYLKDVLVSQSMANSKVKTSGFSINLFQNGAKVLNDDYNSFRAEKSNQHSRKNSISQKSPNTSVSRTSSLNNVKVQKEEKRKSQVKKVLGDPKNFTSNRDMYHLPVVFIKQIGVKPVHKSTLQRLSTAKSHTYLKKPQSNSQKVAKIKLPSSLSNHLSLFQVTRQGSDYTSDEHGRPPTMAKTTSTKTVTFGVLPSRHSSVDESSAMVKTSGNLLSGLDDQLEKELMDIKAAISNIDSNIQKEDCVARPKPTGIDLEAAVNRVLSRVAAGSSQSLSPSSPAVTRIGRAANIATSSANDAAVGPWIDDERRELAAFIERQRVDFSHL